MLKEFKDFALKGNVMDMAVGIIIGAAFGTVIKSLVADVIMPPIGMMMGGVDFSEIVVTLQEATVTATGEDVAAVTMNIGVFLNTIISFLIVAFAIFMMIKALNSAKRKEEAAPPSPTEKECPKCISKISIKATRCPNCTSEVPAAA